ncbi:HpcH/HpaI aldolase/citrate lyase family protein [Salinisphaera aquimarina]|uniref:HpcH/HpaI aldolase/citrate lyase family protein n=1 Tax=Salinisphaera aquimarina TaxID=2094031 RepID=A0ABV7ET55_9GAMM
MINRSYLFVPGNRPERFDKACASGAHVVVLDLEDAVSPDMKSQARGHVETWLRDGGQAYVRINSTDTEWFDDDCELFSVAGIRGVMLPKADSRAQVEAVASRLPQNIPLIALIESATGLCNALDIARVEGVQRLAFGSVDYQVDTGIEGDAQELLYTRSKLVIESRAAGIESPIDGVTLAVKDTAAVARDVESSKRVGMGGKLCIHPAQVEPVNLGFLPSESDVTWAHEVIAALDAQPNGVATFKGKIIDKPVIERARRIVASV